MIAAVFRGPGDIQLRELGQPKINRDEILVEVRACAICGTDIRIIKGEKTKGVRIPSVLGHEIAGVVAEVGEEVSSFKVGCPVAVAPVLPCRKCFYCKNDMENACLNRKAFGYEFDGGFSQYLKVPAVFLESGNIFAFSDEITFEEACLAEPLGCVVNGSERCSIALGDVIVILGAGPIGLMHTLLAKFKGAGKVIVSEPLESRRNLAKILGADIVVNPEEENLQEIVFGATGELGADAAILSVGISSLVMPAMKLLRRGGILNLFGGFPKGETALIDPNLAHYEEIWITGTTACKRSHYEKALQLISEKMIDLKPLISNRFELRKFKEALQTAEAGAGIKIIVKPS